MSVIVNKCDLLLLIKKYCGNVIPVLKNNNTNTIEKHDGNKIPKINNKKVTLK